MTERAHWRIEARAPRGEATDVRRLTDAADVEPYLADAAHYPGGHTDAVLFPRSEADVAAIVAAAKPILAIGAQSSLTGGATPQGETVVSTERMNDVREWGEGWVRVGPGLILADLLAQLAERGSYYPPVPTYDGASVGGTVATNAAGAATFKYGPTRPWIRALTVVLASGRVLDLRRGRTTAHPDGYFEILDEHGRATRVEVPRAVRPDVPKHSAGYFGADGMDLIDLFIGAEGTLGFVVDVELDLVAPRPAWFVGMTPLASAERAFALSTALRDASETTRRTGDARGIDVAAIEYMDRRSIELLAADGAPAREGVELPADAEALVLFQADLPADTTTAMAYDEIAGIDDVGRDGPLLRLMRLLEAEGVLDSTVVALPGEDAKRRSLFALREAVPAGVNARIRAAQRDVDPSISKAAADVIVPYENFETAMRRYADILDRRGLDYAIWGHVSDGNVHPNVMATTAAEMLSARDALLELGDAAIELGGAPMSEHGTGRSPIKKELLRRLHGDAGVASMRRVKAALDPCGLFAPGVLWDPADG